jgi:hypothetical protein
MNGAGDIWGQISGFDPDISDFGREIVNVRGD